MRIARLHPFAGSAAGPNSRYRHVVIALALLLFGPACRLQAEKYSGVEVRRGLSAVDRQVFAEQFVTQRRLDWLVQRVEARFPAIEREQLAKIRLPWQRMDLTAANGRTFVQIYVVVSVPTSIGKDTDSVLRYCTRELRGALDSE